MAQRSVLSTLSILIIALMISACSRQALYDNAIDWERSVPGWKNPVSPLVR